MDPAVGNGRDSVASARSGVLVDLFGTLVDFGTTFSTTLHRILSDNSLEDRAEEFRARWHSFVFQGVAAEGFITVRNDFTGSLVRVLEDHGRTGDLQAYAEGVIDEMFESLRVAGMYQDAREAVDAIDGAGMPWAVVSNVDEAELRALLEHHDLRPVAAISSESVRSYKPMPEIFHAALDRLRMAPEEVVHVGDSPKADVVGAIGAGIDPAWLNRRGTPYPQGIQRPRWEISDLLELRGILDGSF